MDNKNKRAFWDSDIDNTTWISDNTEHIQTYEDVFRSMYEKIDQLEKRVAELEADRILLEEDYAD